MVFESKIVIGINLYYRGSIALARRPAPIFVRVNEVQGSCAHRVDVVLRLVGPLGARSTRKDVFLQRGQFGFVPDHTQVIPFEVVVGNVFPFHNQSVRRAADFSQQFFANSSEVFDLKPTSRAGAGAVRIGSAMIEIQTL
jgi:hypothetical protein